ncbi:chromate efflux transporter [Pseudorhodoferax sp. Leaf267]|uniref:chromate efflux transporter n=1 Tax=Pseudorhodoferax sp. Leaf267 TaxID=1736316 RepID=UPI0006F44E99|nr:chromate efflux transporter [Pseudorhodoferax sp. Leaf267]KQP23537.1 chromate transporter [Pseudorhodoferax sp. Leaf267]
MRSTLKVFLAFLQLGLTSFGGPVAHIAYFRAEFVDKRRWLDEASFLNLVVFCQFLPGPASSKVGIALGLRRAGGWGALAAWLGFTMPSAIALIVFAYGATRWTGLASSGAVQGLKIAAVAVVAQAVWSMGKAFCPDRLRASLAVAAALLVWAVPGAAGQFAAIALGAVVGRWALRLDGLAPLAQHDYGVSRRTGAMLLAVFGLLLVALPALAAGMDSLWVSAIAAMVQAGGLVFGGGHLVLPLLHAGVVAPGWVGNDAFLAGYGATQAVPGPLFTFAAYLGAVMPSPLGGWAGGLVLLVAIFVPGFLLVVGALPFWESLRQQVGVRQAAAGINAAVVGLLASALVDPVGKSAIHSLADGLIALAAFALLVVFKVSPVAVVGFAAVCGWLVF